MGCSVVVLLVAASVVVVVGQLINANFMRTDLVLAVYLSDYLAICLPDRCQRLGVERLDMFRSMGANSDVDADADVVVLIAWVGLTVSGPRGQQPKRHALNVESDKTVK